MKHIYKNTLLAVLSATLFASIAFSQGFTLSTSNFTSWFYVNDNTESPLLRDFGDGSFCLGGHFAGPYGFGGLIPPIGGAGARLMWCPGKAAFRVGYVDGTQWDADNIGAQSIAMGYNSIASGLWSIAIGYSLATGYNSTAINGGIAGGTNSVAICYGETSGEYSVAIGSNATASGDNSTAMGNHVSTNSKEGAFIIGDNSTYTTTNSSADNEMTMRFVGGYRLFTDNLGHGAGLSPGAEDWHHLSDSTKKELFKRADGEYFLSSIAKLRLGSWNYKGQDARYYRHYGPMAQEIFYYFGKDAYGTIGNDTTLTNADMNGIMIICLQAMEKRTTELSAALNELKAEKEKVMQLQTSFNELKNEVIRMKSNIQSLTEVKTKQPRTNVTLNTANEGQ